MFLLVPAHPGFPGQIPQSRKTVVLCVVCVQSVYYREIQIHILGCFLAIPVKVLGISKVIHKMSMAIKIGSI